MPNRRAPYFTSSQTSIDFAAPDPQPVAPIVTEAVAEPAKPGYGIKPGWVDTAERTRTWVLRDPAGTQMAEITTKRDARKLADLLNRVMGDGRSR